MFRAAARSHPGPVRATASLAVAHVREASERRRAAFAQLGEDLVRPERLADHAGILP